MKPPRRVLRKGASDFVKMDPQAMCDELHEALELVNKLTELDTGPAGDLPPDVERGIIGAFVRGVQRRLNTVATGLREHFPK